VTAAATRPLTREPDRERSSIARRPGEVTRDEKGWLDELNRTLTSVSSKTHSLRLYEAMGRRSGVDLRPYLFGVLSRVQDLQPVRVSDVAQELDYERSTVSRHVAELASLGCLERLADPRDGRVVMLRLTKKGERVINQVWQSWLELLAEITDGWSRRDCEAFLKLMTRFDDSFNRLVAEL
jgi:DNA-binding MarR family transcriptional regulator